MARAPNLQAHTAPCSCRQRLSILSSGGSEAQRDQATHLRAHSQPWGPVLPLWLGAPCRVSGTVSRLLGPLDRHPPGLGHVLWPTHLAPPCEVGHVASPGTTQGHTAMSGSLAGSVTRPHQQQPPERFIGHLDHHDPTHLPAMPPPGESMAKRETAPYRRHRHRRCRHRWSP